MCEFLPLSYIHILPYLTLPNHANHPSNTQTHQTIPHLHPPHHPPRISSPPPPYLLLHRRNRRNNTKSPIHDPRRANIPNRHFGENHDLYCEWCDLWSTGFETRNAGIKEGCVGGVGGGYETVRVCAG